MKNPVGEEKEQAPLKKKRDPLELHHATKRHVDGLGGTEERLVVL